MKLLKQVCLLMWKNWLLQKKKICVSIFQTIIPALMALFFVWVRSKIEGDVIIPPSYNQEMFIEPHFFNEYVTIGYTPTTEATDTVMNNALMILKNMRLFMGFSIHGFTSEEEAVSFHKSSPNEMQHIFVFDIPSQEVLLPRNLKITIRTLNYNYITKETYIYTLDMRHSTGDSQGYNYFGFLYLQTLICQALLQYWSHQEDSSLDNKYWVLLKKFAFPQILVDNLTNNMHFTVPLLLVMSFFLCVIVNTKMIVYEKERKIKESLSVMGLSQLAQRIAWSLTFSCYLIPAMAFLAMSFCLKIVANGAVLLHSDGTVFFVFLVCYACAIITFCFTISAFVKKATTGAVLSGVVFVVLFFPYAFLLQNYFAESRMIKFLYGLSFNCAMSIGVNVISISESEGAGIQWNNFYKTPTVDGNISLLDSMLMLLLDSGIHILIAWYMENVMPGEFGIPRPYYFCFTRSFWFPKSTTEAIDSEGKEPKSDYFEKEPTDKIAGIRISNLYKKFGPNIAVNGITLNMYKGQITALLGHNGAGKTTTLFLLTGFIPANGGTVIISDYDIKTNLESAREGLGVCPQYDILFDTLTVYEHLMFFAKVKNIKSSELKSEVQQMAKNVELENKLNTRSKNLSGGQKRKLSVAIALIGGSKVVVLDEPTSGMDPTARRHMWSVLQEARKDRTILLSTHFMDEADVLGDRIAIMVEGVIKCCGSSLFLKKLYGTGYHLVVVMKKDCNVPNLTSYIKSYIPNAELEIITNTEVSYLLPDSESSKFSNLFHHLEIEKVKLKIDSFGTSATTMEEVFFKVGETFIDHDNEVGVYKDSKNNGIGTPDLTLTLTKINLVVVKSSTCDVNNLTRTITKFIPQVEVVNTTAAEVIYCFPENELTVFKDLLHDLETHKNELRIESFELSSEATGGALDHDTNKNLSDLLNQSKQATVVIGGSQPLLTKINLVVVKSSTCDVNNLTRTITKFIPQVEVVNTTAAEVIYCFPENELTVFKDLLHDLETHKNELRIESFELSSEATGGALDHDTNKNSSDLLNQSKQATVVIGGSQPLSFNTDYIKKSGFWLVCSRMYGIMVKKLICTSRRWLLFVPQMFIPVLTALFISMLVRKKEFIKSPSLSLDLSPFGQTYIPYTDGRNPSPIHSVFASLYAKQFGSSHIMEYFEIKENTTFDNNTIDRATEIGIDTYKRKMVIGMEVIPLKDPEKIAYFIAYYSGFSLHSSAISVNYVLNTIYQFFLNDTFSIQMSINPLPERSKMSEDSTIPTEIIFTGMILSLGMSITVTLFIIFLIQEREVGAKHIQTICGVDPVIYWLPTFLLDSVIYMLSVLPIVIIFLNNELSPYIDEGKWLLLILVLILYGWGLLPHMYAFQFLFKSTPTAISLGIIYSIFTGVFLPMGIIFVKISLEKDRYYRDEVDITFMVMFPSYSFNDYFINMLTDYFEIQSCLADQRRCLKQLLNESYKDACGDNCTQSYSDYIMWDKPGVGANLLFMLIHGPMCFLIVLAIDYHVIQRIWYYIARDSIDYKEISYTEDEDVATERQRINSTKHSFLLKSDSLVLVNLHKRYKDFVAVDHICLGVPEQECFGLLGQNGAGKTTIFKMLTGDVMVTGGNAYLKGFDVKNNIHKVQTQMGYCPQFDALINDMTGRETLTLYARLRGIPEDKIKMVVEGLSDSLMITPHIDKYVSQYSGGNKRKLSTAVALIGNPIFVMLDEPSAGMDPEAKRYMWKLLSQVRASGCTLVLTSHSMEECDALCTRLAIMVNGRFMCLGSPQHLKNKFGQGYTLITQLKTLEDGTYASNQPAIDFFISHFHDAKVFDDHQGYIHFQILDSRVTLAEIFDIMETAKAEVNVNEYSVHQTTLEQVFLSLSKTQVPPTLVRNPWNLFNVFPCQKRIRSNMISSK